MIIEMIAMVVLLVGDVDEMIVVHAIVYHEIVIQGVVDVVVTHQ